MKKENGKAYYKINWKQANEDLEQNQNNLSEAQIKNLCIKRKL